MSIDIIRINELTVIARTKCDDCDAILEERPAHDGEHPGTTLLVYNWCKPCAKKQGFPETMEELLKMKFYTVQGPCIANLKALSRVRIKK